LIRNLISHANCYSYTLFTHRKMLF